MRGWWLLTVAAAVTAVLSAVGRAYTGLAAAVAVGVGTAVVAVLAERGRAHLADRAKATAGSGERVNGTRHLNTLNIRLTQVEAVGSAGHWLAVDARTGLEQL